MSRNDVYMSSASDHPLLFMPRPALSHISVIFHYFLNYVFGELYYSFSSSSSELMGLKGFSISLVCTANQPKLHDGGCIYNRKFIGAR